MININNILHQIQLGEFEYDIEFVGCIFSSFELESDKGLFYSVSLYADDKEDKTYANHTIRIGEDIVTCHEYIDQQRKWYMNDEDIDLSRYKDIQVLLNNIIKPFNFESYAIDNFDKDAISESIPYGDPYCLIIDGCVFILENEGSDFKTEDVRHLLESFNWSKERIINAIEEGYEITPDVWDVMCYLPIVYK